MRPPPQRRERCLPLLSCLVCASRCSSLSVAPANGSSRPTSFWFRPTGSIGRRPFAVDAISGSFASHGGEKRDPDDLSGIERIYAISDLHVDNLDNLKWLEERCRLGRASTGKERNAPGPNDALIVAGDVSHEPSRLERSLSMIVDGLGCKAVFFVFGNHEAWVGGDEMNDLGIESSLDKLDRVERLCEKLGVRTGHALVGGRHASPAWIVPVQAWYDGTLSIPGCESLCENFDKWPWVDFMRCKWPPGKSKTGRIPMGLTERMLERNVGALEEVRNDLRRKAIEEGDQKQPGLITFSHFLPNQITLPDWSDVTSKVFRHEWLDHPVPDISAKFALVAGSSLIDEQIRTVTPLLVGHTNENRHLHVFGHSHRPKDFVYEDIRYVHNPLGKPRERGIMISSDVDFQFIWDCTTERGEVPGEQILRYWEEQGGGKEALAKSIRRRRRRPTIIDQRTAVGQCNADSIIGGGDEGN